MLKINLDATDRISEPQKAGPVAALAEGNICIKVPSYTTVRLADLGTLVLAGTSLQPRSLRPTSRLSQPAFFCPSKNSRSTTKVRISNLVPH